ncbi:MAG: hypothetical protein WCT08_04910 [Patescibacteria group bacterium]|jgi:hypothetical protein
MKKISLLVSILVISVFLMPTGLFAYTNVQTVSQSALLPLGRVLGENIVKPTLKNISLTNGAYKFKSGKKTISLKPFPGYSGKVMARAINFGGKSGTVYLFIPQGSYSKAIVSYYLPSNYSKRREIYPFSNTSGFKGWNASISVEPLNYKVYLALGTKKVGASARIVEITSKGLLWVNNPTVVETEGKGAVLVQFLKLYPLQNGLVTMISGNTSSLKVWKYSSSANRYDQDKNFDVSAIKVDGEKISL